MNEGPLNTLRDRIILAVLAEALKEGGINYPWHLHVTAVNVDLTAVLMGLRAALAAARPRHGGARRHAEDGGVFARVHPGTRHGAVGLSIEAGGARGGQARETGDGIT
jgi:hypothetical protein